MSSGDDCHGHDALRMQMPKPKAAGVSEFERCNQEIAEIEALIRAGHPEIEGLCLALADWYAERRILERGTGCAKQESPPRPEPGGRKGVCGEATSRACKPAGRPRAWPTRPSAPSFCRAYR